MTVNGHYTVRFAEQRHYAKLPYIQERRISCIEYMSVMRRTKKELEEIRARYLRVIHNKQGGRGRRSI